MADRKMSLETMEYMVWVIDIAAKEFFKGDKTAAYNAMKDSGIWNLYVETYDTTHTLGKEYITDEIKEYFTKRGVIFP